MTVVNDAANPANSKVSVEVKTASVETLKAEREEPPAHDRSVPLCGRAAARRLGRRRDGTVAPGAGLLEELERLVGAGLTPEEALATATSAAAAEFLHRETQFGRIRTGLRADLLLVHGDPRVDITVLRRRG